ncbi:MAG TPA: hypothetical protein EYH57_01515 [Sulfurovum sp.]|nr:hypothetical protein [Sulfurovum sp.]
MKKKLIGVFAASIAVFALSGCGGGGDDYIPPVDDLITLLIVNQNNVGIDGIRYECDSTSGFTGNGPLAGEFTFRDFDDCDFYLEDSIVLGDDLFIVDSRLVGKNNIPYSCASGIDGFTGDTGFDGEFLYDNFLFDDVCTFEF